MVSVWTPWRAGNLIIHKRSQPIPYLSSSLPLSAQLLCQGHCRGQPKENCHLLQEGHSSQRRNHLWLQVSNWGREDPLFVWGTPLPRDTQLKCARRHVRVLEPSTSLSPISLAQNIVFVLYSYLVCVCVYLSVIIVSFCIQQLTARLDASMCCVQHVCTRPTSCSQSGCTSARWKPWSNQLHLDFREAAVTVPLLGAAINIRIIII